MRASPTWRQSAVFRRVSGALRGLAAAVGQPAPDRHPAAVPAAPPAKKGRSTPEGVAVVALDYDTYPIQLVASSHMEREWRSRSCAKEPWTVRWIERVMSGGGVLYDIGANVGTFSLIAAKTAEPASRVVAFEPGYASYAHLCDNIVLNQCQDSIIPLPIALGRSTGLGTFRYNTLDPGQSRHRFQDGGWNPVGKGQARHYHQPVVVLSLDEAVRQLQLPAPTQIKLDVDGAELGVLEGGTDTLAGRELGSILIEIDDTLSEPVVSFLARHGFVLAEKFKREHAKNTQVWYGVFSRPV